MYTTTVRTPPLMLFSKGDFLRTHRVGPLGLNGFHHLGLLFGFFHPYESWPLFSGWWWVVVVGRITFLIFFFDKHRYFFFLFF